MPAIPGIVDAHVQQELDAPELSYTIDRTRAQELGLNVNTVANNLNISLSSSEQVSPNFWTDPKNGIPYLLRRADAGISDRQQERPRQHADRAARQSGGAVVPDLLGNVATAQRVPVQSVYNHSNIQPVYDVYASVQDRDLGSAAAAIQKVVQEMQGKLGPADRIVIRGQIDSMNRPSPI